MKIKPLYIVLGIILILLVMNAPKKEAQGDVSSAVITRSFSASTIKVGTTITATYTASGMGTGSYGVLISDTATGCTPTTFNSGFLSPITSTTQVYTAPGTAGTCTFSGTYIFGTSTDKTILGTTTINVCADECTSGQKGCTTGTQRWDCNTAGVCGVKINTNCNANEVCSSGVCVADCPTLKSTALSSVSAWALNPTTTAKNSALIAITSWAGSC
jgi:hypothetical protein